MSSRTAALGSETPAHSSSFGLMAAAIGVVYGDIGTSSLLKFAYGLSDFAV